MAADLEGSRRAVDESTVQLSAANAALEARRGELETMLETIPNGVATLDAERRIVLTNRALSEMMDPGGQRPFLGRVDGGGLSGGGRGGDRPADQAQSSHGFSFERD